MPNRAIKESCRTSRTLAQLTAGAEVLHWRLVTVADDFGRFDANPSILKSLCFPLKDKLRVVVVAAWFQEMVSVGLVKTYQDGVRLLGYYPAWAKHQRIRCAVSKFPEPPNEAIPYSTFKQRAIPKELRIMVMERDGNKCLACGATDFLVMDHIIPVISGGEATIGNLQTLCDDCNSAKYTRALNFLEMGNDARKFAATRRDPPRDAPDPDPDPDPDLRSLSVTQPVTARGNGYSPGFEAFWRAYPNTEGTRKEKGEAFKNWKAMNLEPRADEILAAIRKQDDGDSWFQKDGKRCIPYPARWLKRRRFDDLDAPGGSDAS